MPHVAEGRVWKFGDNINTDLIYPNTAFAPGGGTVQAHI